MNDKIVKLIEDRLNLGQEKYGKDMDPHDGRDFVQESLEELLDCVVYITTEIIRLQEIQLEIEKVKCDSLTKSSAPHAALDEATG